jgi:hypothetical protein
MKFYTISNDLSISNDERFGNYDKYTVFELLRNIERNFSICIGKMPYSNTPCKILHHPLHPMIANVPYERIIFLSVSHNNMFEWIYQFSHEYCHNIINGTMNGDTGGLSWFEETVCEIASIYHVRSICNQYQTSDYSYLRMLAEDIQKRNHDALLSLPYHTTHQSIRHELLPQIVENLHRTQSHDINRRLYREIAQIVTPLFEENKNLWKIILHFGDSRQWNSLEDLFAHLQETSDDSYSVSLKKLHDMLL